MPHAVSRFPLLALTAILVFGTAPSSRAADIAGWVENWSLPLFSKEGFRTMTARGSRARPDTGKNQIEVVDLNLTLFSGDAARKVETILLSPAATFLPNEKLARGDQSVRFISFNPRKNDKPEVEASGTRWIYEHAKNKISLDGNVRVIFQAELKDLL